jgi:hypothetical protein
VEEKYGEYVIKYSETRDRFEADLDGMQEASSSKLSELKKRLDKIGDEKKAFIKVKVFQINYDNGAANLIEGHVTSRAEDGGAWVTWQTGKREKCGSYRAPYVDTPQNRAAFSQIQTLYADRCVLREKQDAIVEKLQKYEIKRAF